MKYGTYKNRLGVELEVTGFAFKEDIAPYQTLGGIYTAIIRDDLFGTQHYLITPDSLNEAGYEFVEESSE